jgi:hypothetical protein
MKPPRNYMDSDDSLADALEDLLASHRGEGSEEDILDAALDASMDAEGAKRIAHMTGKSRPAPGMPGDGPPVPEGAPEGALPPECADGTCEHPEHWQDMADMPPMEH